MPPLDSEGFSQGLGLASHIAGDARRLMEVEEGLGRIGLMGRSPTPGVASPLAR